MIWLGPGIGWIDDWFDTLDAHAPGVRIPLLFPGEEIMIVSHFKYHLGALVVLATSAAAIAEQREQDRRDRILARSDTLAPVARLSSFKPIEQGEVIGRAEFKKSQNSYLVRYRAGDGRQVEEWLSEDAIEWGDPVPEPEGDKAADTDFSEEPAKQSAAPTPVTPTGPVAEIRICRYAADGGMTSDFTIPLV